MTKRLIYICDWLPPDFGAVGQYAVLDARERASEGWTVTLVGLTSGQSSRQAAEPIGEGSLEVIRVHRRTYQKQKFVARLVWTVLSNVLLLGVALRAMRRADAVLFTGSPPLMLHFIAPLNLVLRKWLIYRIMDFHPECLIAERGRSGFLLGGLLRLTYFWRRRVDTFEVLGHDQTRRLTDMGIAEGRIRLKPHPSPVTFAPGLAPLSLPDELRGASGVILYSGNWGVAHDETTFIEAYSEYFRQSKLGLRFWLNATGAKADRVERELRSRGVPVYRSSLVPLEDLPRLLLAADVHLVTLRDPFVGYVLPSKIHACIEFGKKNPLRRQPGLRCSPLGQPRAATRPVLSGRHWRCGWIGERLARHGTRGRERTQTRRRADTPGREHWAHHGLRVPCNRVRRSPIVTMPMSAIQKDTIKNEESHVLHEDVFDRERELIIEPGRAERHYWRDLWQYRELFRVLAWRDISVRYKQTVIGAAWALIRPFLTMVVFTVIFGKLAGLPSDGAAPYALMVFAGLLPWSFFATALSDASNSLIGNAHLISKVYFPRLIVPIAAVMVAFVDFLISFAILVTLMVWYQFMPGWQVLLLPVFAGIAFMASLGVGVWITALNVKYRDFRYVIPFIVQLGLYVSPVGFSSSVVPDQWRLAYSLNPMVGVIDGFRWCLLGGDSRLYWPGLGLSLAVTVVFLWLGLRQFRKMERSFADLI